MRRSNCVRAAVPPAVAVGGHAIRTLQHLNEGGGLIFCAKCGHYGQVRLVGLLKRCNGLDHPSRSSKLKRMKACRHPVTNEAMVDVTAASSGVYRMLDAFLRSVGSRPNEEKDDDVGLEEFSDETVFMQNPLPAAQLEEQLSFTQELE